MRQIVGVGDGEGCWGEEWGGGWGGGRFKAESDVGYITTF